VLGDPMFTSLQKRTMLPNLILLRIFDVHKKSIHDSKCCNNKGCEYMYTFRASYKLVCTCSMSFIFGVDRPTTPFNGANLHGFLHKIFTLLPLSLWLILFIQLKHSQADMNPLTIHFALIFKELFIHESITSAKV
jgi:hypothetical protein